MSTDSDAGLKAAGADDSQPQFTPRLGFNHLAEEYDGDEVRVRPASIACCS